VPGWLKTSAYAFLLLPLVVWILLLAYFVTQVCLHAYTPGAETLEYSFQPLIVLKPRPLRIRVLMPRDIFSFSDGESGHRVYTG
jgi:hypothetical protein